jgi:hypothetical protein
VAFDLLNENVQKLLYDLILELIINNIFLEFLLPIHLLRLLVPMNSLTRGAWEIVIASRFQNEFSKNLVLQFDRGNPFSFDCARLLINGLIVHDFNIADVSAGCNEVVWVIDWLGTAWTLY